MFTLAWQSPKSGEKPIISHILCLNPLEIATLGFAHLAMTQYTISHINYNLPFYTLLKKAWCFGTTPLVVYCRTELLLRIRVLYRNSTS